MRYQNSFLFCCLVLVICITLPAKGQYLQKPVRVLTTKDGLPQSFISGLVQDKDGFVWIGTRNGLVRYDGIHFKTFQHSSSNTATLLSNLIISLQPDAGNRLWIEYESGEIDCLDPVTEKVEHITDRPLFSRQPTSFRRYAWLIDSVGNFWCSGKQNGLFCYNWKRNRVITFTIANQALPDDTIIGLQQDSQGIIWAVSRNAVSRWDSSTGRFIHTPVHLSLPYRNDFIAVHQRRNKEMMLGDEKQLFFFAPNGRLLRQLPLPPIAATGIHWIQTWLDGMDYFERAGYVYRYTDAKGIAAIADIGLTDARAAKSFLVDHSGFIWLGTDAAGIYQVDLSAPYFESHANGTSFHYDLGKQQLGLSLDRFAGWPLTDPQFSFSSYFVRTTYNSEGKLWLALRDRVGYYTGTQWTMLPPVPGVANPPNTTSGLRGISFAPGGRLWVIGDKGQIFFYDTLQHQWQPFLTASRLQQINPEFSLNDLVTDADHLWIATASGDGLLQISIRTGQVRLLSARAKRATLPADLLLGLKNDPHNPDLLWVGSYEGLICLNKKTLQSRLYTTGQGLPDNTIYAIETDKAGYFWLSTNKGICRFNPQNGEVRTFKKEDGLPGNEFNRFHSLRLPDGKLAFGGTDGWMLFNPLQIKNDFYQPPVRFTGLEINNQPVDNRGASAFLPAPLNQLTELQLPYDQNTLTFSFAGLEFSQPSKIKYRYQLRGYNDGWIETNTPVATYTKLPAGHYVLWVNATNTTGQWSNQVRTLAITVRPPWWQTWWAYGLYIVLLTGLIWAYIRYRIHEERMQQQVLLKEKEAEQLKTVDELKTRFYANITHDFRTPLTLILAPAQQLKPSLQTAEQHLRVEAIERNAYQLLQLINQLLDLSKIESGSLGLHETAGNITAVVQELLLSFSSDAETKGIALLVRSEVENDTYWFDAEKLSQIITNLLANALKVTPAGGKVELALLSGKHISSSKSKEQDGISITISDTGTGIPPDQLPLVFNRFYQVNGENIAGLKGSGIGLSLVKELVELQGGSIEVCSPGKEGGWSTCFTVWLPYRKAEAAAPSIENIPSAVPVTPSYMSQPVVFSGSKPTGNEEERESILLIEDNDELATFIADSLPRQYAISRASNGAEGLKMAFAQVPDLIISDVVMPVMDGFECCRRLKSDERTNHIPVILLTAKAAFDSRITGLTQGADDYLTKPFHVQELQLRINNLLERQRRLRQKWQQEMNQPQAGKPISNASLQIQPANRQDANRQEAGNQLANKQPATEPSVNEQSTAAQPAPAEKPLNDLQEAFIQKLYATVEEKLDETAFGVEELATEIGMSRANLHRKLKALTGMPASDVVRNYRLQRAAAFLKEGFNSSETAYKTGFDSPAYFTKCFRDFFGTTPTDFIKLN